MFPGRAIHIRPFNHFYTMNRKERMAVPWFAGMIGLCCVLVAFSGCTSPQQPVAGAGDTVRVYYSVSFPDGQVFESNQNATPLEFTLGAGQMIAGFDEAVVGMSPGQTKTVTVPPEKGYGLYKPELVKTLDIDTVVSALGVRPEVGTIYIWGEDGGSGGFVQFSNITSKTITADENHPLAGKDLVFTMTLVEIVGK
jgi:peptidylprolyl isomerase